MMKIKGRIKVDKKTKNLVKRLMPGDIAVIDHMDIDEIAAQSLIRAKVKAVINTKLSISGKYPNLGPLLLVKAGVPLLDNVGSPGLSLQDDDEIELVDNQVYLKGKKFVQGTLLTEALVLEKMKETEANVDKELSKFVQNTLEYALLEKDIFVNGLELPEIATNFIDRHALIVVRGKNYREDLQAIKSYINEVKPILIGVDGGADALREFGFSPDIIIGDMDSVSDEALKGESELIVHAYPNGKAPGNERLKKLGRKAVIFPAPGTSEDLAMIVAYEKKATLIVAVGTHSNMIDFLEKGRSGMASTLLVRMKVGSILIDAKGVSQLYKQKLSYSHVSQVFVAGLIPLFIAASLSPSIVQLARLILLKFKLYFQH